MNLHNKILKRMRIITTIEIQIILKTAFFNNVRDATLRFTHSADFTIIYDLSRNIFSDVKHSMTLCCVRSECSNIFSLCRRLTSLFYETPFVAPWLGTIVHFGLDLLSYKHAGNARVTFAATKDDEFLAE